jgi:hypothetical protein
MSLTSKTTSSKSQMRAQAANAVRMPAHAKLDPRYFDMEAFGKEIRQSKETALAFLIKAGIVNKKGTALAKPYRD